jgi:hypothetical protein
MARRDWSKPKHYLDRLLRKLPRRPPGRGGIAMPDPVEPNPNRPLSGGAEAPLESSD